MKNERVHLTIHLIFLFYIYELLTCILYKWKLYDIYWVYFTLYLKPMLKHIIINIYCLHSYFENGKLIWRPQKSLRFIKNINIISFTYYSKKSSNVRVWFTKYERERMFTNDVLSKHWSYYRGYVQEICVNNFIWQSM